MNDQLGGRVPVAGSTPREAPDSIASRAMADEPITVSVRLRQRPGSRPLDEVIEEQQSTPLAERHYLSREEMARDYGAADADVERVVAFARHAGIEVEGVDVGARTVRLRGRAEELATAFGVRLGAGSGRDGQPFRTHAGPVQVPSQLSDIVEGVIGLSNAPVATGDPPPHEQLQ